MEKSKDKKIDELWEKFDKSKKDDVYYESTLIKSHHLEESKEISRKLLEKSKAEREKIQEEIRKLRRSTS